jgi:hypothetical protein
MARRFLIAIAVVALAAFVTPLAQADTGDIVEPQHEPPTSADGFQAGTCYENQVGEVPETSPPSKPTDVTKPFCSPDTPPLWFTQAGGHPPIAFDQYIIRHTTVVPGVVEPLVEDPSDPLPFEDRVLKTERVDLPPGFTENPQSSPQCPRDKFRNEVAPNTFVPACDPSTIVGRNETWLVVNTANKVPVPGGDPVTGPFLPKGFVISPDPAKGNKVPLYNLVPNEGEPARLGFVIAGTRVIELEGGVAWESDFHEYFTIKLPAPSVPFSSLKSRLVAFGQSGDGTHVTLPTTCFDKDEWPHLYSSWFRGESWGEQNPTFPVGSTPWEAKLPPGVQITGCEKVPFDPSVQVGPGTDAVDSPSPATVTTKLPFDPAREGGEVRVNGKGEIEGISQSHVRKGEVTLPKGMGLNPSGAQSLQACTDQAFRKGERNYANACPNESIIGTVEVDSPPLAEALKGNVYVGTQKSREPQSGEEFRILLEAKNENEGIAARLIGHVKADPATGQLTAVLNDKLVGEFAGELPEGLPQVPFESIRVHFNESKQVLTSQPICTAQGTSHFEPWARLGENKPVNSAVTLSKDPSGGDCPKTMAERKFKPGYKANTKKKKAGAYTKFHVHIGRALGQQELKLVDVKLPNGLTGKLRGIPYCSDKALAAAAANSGMAERANSSCKKKSKIGSVTTESGTGTPLKLGGKAFLAGPYKGAPLSMATITPAVAGPFDLGTVVVRVALKVNPKTAQIRAVSDVIPDVFGGVKLDLRSIDVNVNRKKFMVNPTGCGKKATKGKIKGGGADPTDPSAFSSYRVKSGLKVTKCKKLGFKPKLFTKLSGPVKRAGNPKIRAVLVARKGDANIKRTALTLPHSLFLDQSHIRTVCTRVQLKARDCPKAAIYGHAKAQSPLLKKKLKGPVYLVSSDNLLPDLVADLRGQVNIQLHGVISSKRGGLKTVFSPVPDVAVKKFVLSMSGGQKSLLVNSTNLCKSEQKAVLNMKAHNGKQIKNNQYPLKISSCGSGKK